jgi:hypothetical protein
LKITEVIWASGHPNILAIHPTTLMFTKDLHISQAGDCIVAVATDKAVADLSVQFRKELRKPNAKLTVTIEADGIKEQVTASGCPKLCLCNNVDIVIRKSDYVCNCTLAICADKSSKDLSRELIEKLQNPNVKAKIELTVTAD